MSYIKESTQCMCCQHKYFFYWLLPDGMFERIPTDAQIAEHDSFGTYYLIKPKCPRCNMIGQIRHPIINRD